MTALSEQQVEHYWQHGYVVLPALFSPEQLDDFDQRFQAMVLGEVELAQDMKVMRDVMVVKGAVDPQTPVHGVNKLLCLENDAQLFSFVRDPGLVAAVQSLLGESIYSLASNVFNKPPGVDGRHPMHQDLRYFKLSPADGVVGVWTAMLEASRKSGCLAVIPGSHKGELLPHANPDWEFVNHGFYAVEQVDLDARVHVELAPGDTLLFHPLLVHGSGRNRSTQFRRAISVHYAAGSCENPKRDWHKAPFTRQIA